MTVDSRVSIPQDAWTACNCFAYMHYWCLSWVALVGRQVHEGVLWDHKVLQRLPEGPAVQ